MLCPFCRLHVRFFEVPFGERLSNRRFDTQATQAYARLAAMNIMTQLGMPDTVAVC